MELWEIEGPTDGAAREGVMTKQLQSDTFMALTHT